MMVQICILIIIKDKEEKSLWRQYNEKLKIELTQEQLQRVLVFLGNAPYVEIADIIDTVKEQANEQMKEKEVTSNKNPFFAEPGEGEGNGI